MKQSDANYHMALNLYNQAKDAGFGVAKLTKSNIGLWGTDEHWTAISSDNSVNSITFTANSIKYRIKTSTQAIRVPPRGTWDSEIVGFKLCINIYNVKERNIKASSTKKLMDICLLTEENIDKFVSGKVAKMLSSCEARQDKIRKKINDEDEEKRRQKNRCRNWHATMQTMGISSDTYFLDGKCTTMQVKIKPNDDNAIKGIISAVTGKSVEEVSNMFLLEQVK